MRCKIKAESAGRMRIHAETDSMTLGDADVLEYYLRSMPFVTEVKVFDRTCDAIIRYSGGREKLIHALSVFSFDDEKAMALVPDHSGRSRDREYGNRLAAMILRRVVEKVLFPHDLKLILTVMRAIGFVRSGMSALRTRKLNVDVLDGSAITASILTDDHDTGSSIMFLLGVGDLMEDWVRKKSVDDLAGMLSLNVDKAWLVTDEGEKLIPVSEVEPEDRIVVGTGNMIPLDGRIISGEVMVNQASMTGESLPVRKTVGSYVYGGTAVEEGRCIMSVDKASGSGRYDRIVRMIEESEKLKSSTEQSAANLADRLVPYSLLGTALSYILTGNVQTAMAFLMVDFSCALKLTMPLAVMSAMKESSRHNISVKGGKFLENMAQADTLVFDKTGTLTYADPKVARVVAFGGRDEDEMLRLAACLEEHYPHSIANAVVEEARRKDLKHEERHTTVDYVVAHGIRSTIDGQRAAIGSYHFIFEDEGVELGEDEAKAINAMSSDHSLLYLALDDELEAVICIEDPVREDAAEVVEALRREGFTNIVMITGDRQETAEKIASLTGVDRCISEVLPEDKALYIKEEREKGHKVVMVGDGINDSPALSEADVGIAVNSGAAIAREISDITIESDDLERLVLLRKIAKALMNRTRSDYRAIIAFNSMLIALGAGGVITPGTSAIMHNASTILISLYNMTSLLETTKEVNHEKP